MLQSWRAIGFNAVPLSTNDMMTGLQSGMIEAFYAPPLIAASFQWFGLAKNMCSLKVAPMIGGFVISKKTWKQIPDNIKPQLIKASNIVIRDLYTKTKLLEIRALRTMRKHGLRVNNVPSSAVQKWKQIVQKGYNIYLGSTFPKEFFYKLKNDLKTYRKGR